MAQRHGNPHSIARLIARELRSGDRMKDATDRPALSPPAEGEVDWEFPILSEGVPVRDPEANTPTPAPVDWNVVGPKLVEALTEAREALHQHYVDWDGEPEDAVSLQLARAKCDAALASAQPEGK